MRRRYVATGIAVAIIAFFFLAPVVSLVPSDKTDSLAGYKGWAAYYGYGNLTIIYWRHATFPTCGPGIPGCPIGFANASTPEYLPMPTYGSLSYYFLGSGGLAFENGYTIAICVGNSSTDVYCQLPVPCFSNNISWPHDSCF
jgi:hypothetical protein